MNEIEWATIHEAARILNIPIEDLRRYCKDGKICKVKRAPDYNTLRDTIWCYMPDIIRYKKHQINARRAAAMRGNSNRKKKDSLE